MFTLAVTTAKEASVSLSLVIETHSEHLINRLGALVEQGKLQKEDVAIYLVDRENSGVPASVLETQFDQDGVLTDPWPFGFFSAGIS